ncbi:unnamed protein product [Didymodactylos carnosus]|uniref:High-affinity choline transporter 1 n=1 Tax=Didymodactylos carnosus TaxID=1234261 RepID=A0A814E578_9BILA|nr:unnamed protein product [Didymodactylos carnosus]CAF0961544.1 unnamed protein product [Didymodactylos carnosus]CAF3640075.1 unnamed protein product [Didymodactylos carnosus]CAF3736020.1 unnamed protein product [Didymodactylos carnosus]
MVVHVGGLVAIIIFYVLILLVGIWAGRKQKSSEKAPDTEEIMLAGRNIGLLVGVFTMTATWVGGAYINGTAEMVFSTGLLSTQAPLGYAISLICGGLLFARRMRAAGYVTMLDPFQQKYGERMGGLLFLPALMGEVFWSAAILSALGATISVIFTDVSQTASVLISAAIVVFYTLFGGLYSVAYTDVVQLFFIFVGLWLAVPFALKNKSVGSLLTTWPEWRGHIEKHQEVRWIDDLLLLIFGGIPWQVYFQRVLSAKSAHKAMYLSFCAAVGCFLLAVPPALIGAIAKSTNWTATDYDIKKNITSPEAQKLILPLVLQHLCPKPIAWIGLGAVSAAVMSSADSSVLSASSMFARNVWKLVFRNNAGEREVLWVMRIGIFFVGAAAAGIGITVPSIYLLWILCSDLVYVILFPQLLCVVYANFTNTYGSLGAYIVGFLFRTLIGEPEVGIPQVLLLPWFIPPKTFCMLLSLFTILFVSYIAKVLFENRIIPAKYDILHCLVNIPTDIMPLKESTTNEEFSKLNVNDSSKKKYDNEASYMTLGGSLNGPYSPSQETLVYNDIR